MSRNNIKTNNKRDFEMDTLQTRLDSNIKLLQKTTKTLLSEIQEYKEKSEKKLLEILKSFQEIHEEFFQKGGFIF